MKRVRRRHSLPSIRDAAASINRSKHESLLWDGACGHVHGDDGEAFQGRPSVHDGLNILTDFKDACSQAYFRQLFPQIVLSGVTKLVIL